jgi:3',5'-cyclic AMP phosphodiesterase CpdA
VQLTDPHVGASWTATDPAATLAAVVDEVARLAPAPVAVVVTGDLTDHAADAEYELLARLLAPLAGAIYFLPGNHDARGALRRHFAIAGEPDDPVQYSVDLGELRLVVADSTWPGHDGGQLDADRLAWLDAELELEPARATVIAMHHPPLHSAIPGMDAIGLPADATRELGAILARHPQARAVIAGHLHRTVAGTLSGCSVFAAPSTYAQLTLNFSSSNLRFAAASAPGFAVHAVIDGAVASHAVVLSGSADTGVWAPVVPA